MQPPSKRSLRPSASQPSTAEHYGRQHGIPEDIQRALQNVGRKGRMAVSQGRTFDRTQSFPTSSTHSNPFVPFDTTPLSGFMTTQETFQHAERSLNHETAKRELRPYHETQGSGQQSQQGNWPKSSPPQIPLSFGGEGIEEGSTVQKRHRQISREFKKSTKRKEEAEEEDDGSETETSDVELFDDTIDQTPSVPVQDDFPPVFTSPRISQPELFAPKVVPPRLVRNMPGRSLGKTVSAPVGVLGRYGKLGQSGTDLSAGDEDVGMEDGFDVNEWAASEDF